jgi:hypothetical protein
MGCSTSPTAATSTPTPHRDALKPTRGLEPHRHRRLAYLQTGLSTVSGFLAVLTIFWHHWIEVVTGTDPDHHNGSLECLIVAGLAIACMILAVAARHSWRTLRPAAPASSAE